MIENVKNFTGICGTSKHYIPYTNWNKISIHVSNLTTIILCE